MHRRRRPTGTGTLLTMEETARAAVLRLRPLARLASAHVLGDIKVLTDPEGKATNQRPRLGPPDSESEVSRPTYYIEIIVPTGRNT